MSRNLVDSGQEWLGIIPDNWLIFRGRYIFEQRNSKGNSCNLELLSPTQKYGVIPQSLYEELTTNRAVKVNEKTDLNQFKTIHKGDFCISLRSFQGGFEYSEYEGVVSPAYQVFYATRDICEGFYKYLFKTQRFINEMNLYTMSLRDGKNIAFSDFANSFIPYPPTSEQKKIADFLDEKCAEIDSLIADIQHEIDKLERLKRSVIAEAVTKGLNKSAEMKDSGVIWAPVIPKSWKPLKVKYIMYETKTKADTETAEPLSVTQKYGIIKSSEATVANPSQSYEGYKAVNVDDIVFNKYKAHSGVFFSSTYNGMVTFNYSVYRCYEGNVPKYYEYLFHTNGCIGEFKTKMHGVGESISPLYTKDLFAITVIQPTYTDQKNIVEFLDARCAEFDTILSEKQKQIEILQKLKKSVIYEYVTGKKEVK